MVEESDLITLQDEDGLERRFTIVDIVEVDRRRYAVLLPEDEEEEDGRARIFRMESDDRLVPTEDYDELSRVMSALEESGEYSEIILEDEEEGGAEVDVLDDLGGEFEANGENADDDEEEDA